MTNKLVLPPTEEAQWRVLYDAVRQLPHGTDLTYEEIEGITGRDVRADRWLVYATDRALQLHDRKALTNIRGVGYRIAEPTEHVGIVKGRLRRSKRQARKGVLAGEATDLSKIKDPTARQAIIGLTDHLKSVESRMRYHEKRIQVAEARISEVQRESAQTNAQMEERMARLEALLNKH